MSSKSCSVHSYRTDVFYLYVDIRHTMIPHPDPTYKGRFYIPLHKGSYIAFRFARERVENAVVEQTKQRGRQKSEKGELKE